MIPENEQLYVKRCWKCEASYKSQSPFVLELCQECWIPVHGRLKRSASIVLVIGLGALYGVVAYALLEGMSRFVLSLASFVSVLFLKYISDKLNKLEEDGWLNWIPLLFGKRGK